MPDPGKMHNDPDGSAMRNMNLFWLQRALHWMDRIARWRGNESKLPGHLETGVAGEEAVLFFLRRSGFTVVAQRWNDGPLPGDLDLIAWRDDRLCFLEVKTRSSKDFASASSAVDYEKRKHLRGLARQYLRQLPDADAMDPPETRFDIVTVYDLPGRPREIQLIPAAFGWSE